jgi:glycosyltransferase involved in cell wall biosynthesis
MKELYVIINERIYNDSKNYFCENKDIQSTINYLSYKYYLIIISRYSACVQPFKLNKVLKNFNFRLIKIFHFFIFLFSFSREKKILLISITPFNFIIFFIFKFLFNCKFLLYLRSNGYEEYKSILGKRYIWIYDFMFKYITKYSKVISCHKRLYNKKSHVLYPSELNRSWKKKIRKNYFRDNTINLLYVGRFKIEKGIYSLLKIFSNLPNNIKLNLVGNGDPIKITDDRIKVINFVKNEKRLINIYDSSNILILPSYTEAHPKVIDESLSRMRPVIVFNDIKYVIQKRYGVFSIKRNASQLTKIINYIKRNDQLIFNQLKKNQLPQRIDFLENLNKIISLD